MIDEHFVVTEGALMEGKEYIEAESEGVLSPVLQNFGSLTKLDEIHKKAVLFD